MAQATQQPSPQAAKNAAGIGVTRGVVERRSCSLLAQKENGAKEEAMAKPSEVLRVRSKLRVRLSAAVSREGEGERQIRR